MNPAYEYVETSKSTSPIHRFVADEGEGVTKSDIDHVTVAGRDVALSDGINAEDLELIKNAIEVTRPTEKDCYANALNMWQYDNRFAFVEGFAIMADIDVGGISHSWCLLDGEKLVDPTAAFDSYFGVTITEPEILHRYANSDPSNGIISNHNNRYEFLRQRGYVDDWQ